MLLNLYPNVVQFDIFIYKIPFTSKIVGVWTSPWIPLLIDFMSKLQFARWAPMESCGYHPSDNLGIDLLKSVSQFHCPSSGWFLIVVSLKQLVEHLSAPFVAFWKLLCDLVCQFGARKSNCWSNSTIGSIVRLIVIHSPVPITHLIEDCVDILIRPSFGFQMTRSSESSWLYQLPGETARWVRHCWIPSQMLTTQLGG